MKSALFILFSIFLTFVQVECFKIEDYQILHLSDLHIDPIYDPLLPAQTCYCRQPCSTPLTESEKADFGRIGCNLPKNTFFNTLSTLKRNISPSLIIITGDVAAHDLEIEDCLAMHNLFQKELNSTFPDVNKLFVIGNNDVSPDYDITVSWLKNMSEVYKDWFKTSEEFNNFRKGGYYTRYDENVNIQFLIVNSLLFAANNKYVPYDSFGQFEFIEETLKNAAKLNRKVSFLMHIPFGIDYYKGSLLWKQEAQDRFFKIITKYSSNIIVGLGGHTHHDGIKFSFIDDNPLNPMILPLFVLPALSPVYINNPAVGLIKVNPNTDSRITDIARLAIPLIKIDRTDTFEMHKEYSFCEAYELCDFSKQGLRSYLFNLAEGLDPPFFGSLINNVDNFSSNHPYLTFLHYFSVGLLKQARHICAMSQMQKDNFFKCLDKYEFPDQHDPLL
eukprot:TRINITY_DN3252_c0_g1_i1.p1 TRINITY_DN3252_c0_g1~~TRINITY_DN3252_c0_g1_i1.p1  ORF type:complete len:445 (+),score=106.38 TRINITY_DN3252_c0_g1_i1:45-1379(+)